MHRDLSSFLAAFETVTRERGSDSLQEARRDALRDFRELGLPTTKQEEWRFTNVAPIAEGNFTLGRPTTNGVTGADVEKVALAPGLVFVDGHFRADLSTVPAGVRVGSLATSLDDEIVRTWLGSQASTGERAFVALNTALVEDGAFLHLPKGTVIEEPLHVLFVGTRHAAYPRNLYVLEESASATIVETYVSHGEDKHFTNSVTEIAVGANASLNHYRLQLESDRACHVATTHASQARDSRFTANAVTIGGALTRNDIVATLDDEGALCTLNGIFLTKGAQHVDNHTWIEHRKPHCESHELYKGILDDRSSGVFSGYIHVFEDAQKTDAYQSSANLLLSDEATVDSQPQLEIYADDVKCSHGSTIGQMDKDALFYLRARGIPEKRARNMLIHAFAHDVTDRIEVVAARERLDRVLAEQLPG